MGSILVMLVRDREAKIESQGSFNVNREDPVVVEERDSELDSVQGFGSGGFEKNW